MKNNRQATMKTSGEFLHIARELSRDDTELIFIVRLKDGRTCSMEISSMSCLRSTKGDDQEVLVVICDEDVSDCDEIYDAIMPSPERDSS